jgi:hypothetical protein
MTPSTPSCPRKKRKDRELWLNITLNLNLDRSVGYKSMRCYAWFVCLGLYVRFIATEKKRKTNDSVVAVRLQIYLAAWFNNVSDLFYSAHFQIYCFLNLDTVPYLFWLAIKRTILFTDWYYRYHLFIFVWCVGRKKRTAPLLHNHHNMKIKMIMKIERHFILHIVSVTPNEYEIKIWNYFETG